MSNPRPTYTLADLQAMIRETGLRCTTSRTTVLQRLIEASSPVSHAELVEELAPMGFDQATIYRNLTDLAEVGLLTRLDLGDRVWRFEFRGGEESHADGEHPHFVCTDCGKVSCLPDVSIQITHATPVPGFGGEICEIFLKGRCEQCT